MLAAANTVLRYKQANVNRSWTMKLYGCKETTGVVCAFARLRPGRVAGAAEQGQRELQKGHIDQIRIGFKKHRERTQGTPPPAKMGEDCRAMVEGQWGSVT